MRENQAMQYSYDLNANSLCDVRRLSYANENLRVIRVLVFQLCNIHYDYVITWAMQDNMENVIYVDILGEMVKYDDKY